MKEYTLTIKFQVEDPENSTVLKQIKDNIESGEAYTRLTYGDVVTTNIKLEEDETTNQQGNILE